MAFAENTSVSVARSKAEIEDLLSRHGASKFASGRDDIAGTAHVVFSLRTKDSESLMVRMTLPLPRFDKFAKRMKRGQLVECTPDEQHKAYEQACRTRWRALLLVVKAKLEACDAGISTIEREFMPDVVMDNGHTIGDMVMHRLPQIASGKAPLLLEGGRA